MRCCTNSKRPSLLAVAPDDHGVCVLASIDREVEVNWPQDCNWRERFAEVGSTSFPLPVRALDPCTRRPFSRLLAIGQVETDRPSSLRQLRVGQWLSQTGCGLTVACLTPVPPFCPLKRRRPGFRVALLPSLPLPATPWCHGGPADFHPITVPHRRRLTLGLLQKWSPKIPIFNLRLAPTFRCFAESLLLLPFSGFLPSLVSAFLPFSHCPFSSRRRVSL